MCVSFSRVTDDFKPASVDVHKEATLETGSNSQVTVTVPHLGKWSIDFAWFSLILFHNNPLDGSGVPNTIFKGSSRDYTKKECVLIINKDTNEIILERLCSNVQVKKTRTDSSNKPQPAIITSKIENQTARQSSKTRVSTGTVRKNVLHYVPKHSPLQQGSPSYPHRSPQQTQSQWVLTDVATFLYRYLNNNRFYSNRWNASNNTSTLPSITSLLDDNFANNQPSSMYNNSSKSNNNNNCNISNNVSAPTNASNLLPKAASAMQSQQSMAVDDVSTCVHKLVEIRIVLWLVLEIVIKSD